MGQLLSLVTMSTGIAESRRNNVSHALYRLGRFAARRPWVVIGAWLVISVVVIAASGAFGRELESEGSVPGLDSQEAVDLLSAAESETAGLTAQLVMTP